MTKKEFIAKYEGWFSYTRREELKKEMETDLEEMFAALRQTPVIGSSIQEKYDELVKEITRLQEKYDENGYDYPPILKLRRIEAHVDMSIDILSKNCR